jgi:DNA recombination protein RmuC
LIRRPGLVDRIQREFRVVVAGPTTLAALLNSLQMGFRTLAIQQRSSEVWNVLSSVKSELGKFGAAIEGVRKKLVEAQNKVDDVTTRSRQLSKKLEVVQDPNLLSNGEPSLPLEDSSETAN